MTIDPLRLAIAVVPIVAYFALLGLINLRRKPFLTNGASDAAALALALSGLAVIGPMELFMPWAAANRFGPYVWIFLLVLYWLSVSLVILLARPRILIYNISTEELRPALAEVARELDNEAKWAGDALTLPTLGVQLHLDTFHLMRHVSLASNGARQNLASWRQLEIALAAAMQKIQVPPNPRAVGLFGMAAILALSTFARLLSNPLAIARAMREMFP